MQRQQLNQRANQIDCKISYKVSASSVVLFHNIDMDNIYWLLLGCVPLLRRQSGDFTGVWMLSMWG